MNLRKFIQFGAADIMKVLVINCGSSSIKFQLLEMETKCYWLKGK